MNWFWDSKYYDILIVAFGHLTIDNILSKDQPLGHSDNLTLFMTGGIDPCPSWTEFLQNFL